MSRRIVGFGEAMLRLTVPVAESLETAGRFQCYVGGAELNGLIAAARTGAECRWVSALPNLPMAQIIVRHSRSNGVEPVVSLADRGRVGLYFLELAAPPRPARIFYDRGDSAFADLDPESLDWGSLLEPGTCLYLTSITAAVGSGPRRAVEAAIRTARDVGALVALDVNYRSGLWSEAAAAAWIGEVIPYVDVLSASNQDLAMIGIGGTAPHRQAVGEFGLKAVIGTTKRFTEDGTVRIELVVADPSGEHRWEETATVVDPVGAGDALFGTFLGTLADHGPAEAGRRALGAAVACYGLHGDALVVDPWVGNGWGGLVR